MTSAAAETVAERKQIEDPLSHLPCSTVSDFKKNQVIYGPDNPLNNIFLVLSGKVNVSRITENRQPIVIDIYRTDEFFGELAFLTRYSRSEMAIAAEPTQLMSWGSGEIEEISLTRPKLAIGLMQLQAQRSEDFVQRIVGLSVDTIGKRLANALIRFAERLGGPHSDGSIEMSAFTHQFLAQHVGTSREIITHYMNDFRTKGFLRYSRKSTQVYLEPLKAWLVQVPNSIIRLRG
jgi:CRP/FNR family cyclic AMP-dependent transcriptional regulator